MLCRKLKQTFFAKSTAKQLLYRNEIYLQFSAGRSSWFHDVFIGKTPYSMSSVHKFRQLFRDFHVTRLWSSWSSNVLIDSVIRKCSRERVVREMVQCLRQTFIRPSRTLLLTVTAAYKAHEDKDLECHRNITDEELKDAISDLDNVDNLSLKTVFCTKCQRRLVIDKKYNGITYCSCKDGQPEEKSLDGWIPFLEAEDVIIWRKEYKNRSGVYAYKIYGRYNEIKAEDFAAIQVDGNYRMEWDTAVAGLMVIEDQANGLKDQTVLHWEVLWPKLFQNRDYVYIRRHKDFTLKSKRLQHKDRLFNNNMPKDDAEEKYQKVIPRYKDTENVHSRAKRISQQKDEEERLKRIEERKMNENRVFIILSRSCDHAEAPANRNVIRVTEYWSHMVIRTLDGPDKPGMEFVLTYFDAPSTGALPTGVTAWATGRAAPNYLDTMRRAADHYRDWLRTQMPVNQETEVINEKKVKDTSTQTDEDILTEILCNNNNNNDNNNVTDAVKKDVKSKESNPEETVEKIDQESNGSWWRYFYPLYYFM